jgi:hypothetical protein
MWTGCSDPTGISETWIDTPWVDEFCGPINMKDVRISSLPVFFEFALLKTSI